MTLKLLIISGFCLIISGCQTHDDVTMVSTSGRNAESVYLTHDERNNPVVAWTESDGNNLALSFATSTDNGRKFSEKKILPLTKDVATHAEGMPKVAYKGDGTIVVAYEKKAPTKENKYAGAVYYVMSTDNGKSWSAEKFLHSDTVAGRSRSYFDIERLADGEIGASWLDVKLNQETGGRSIRFAKTSRGQGFDNEILVDSSACQCCRLDVYTDLTGNVNVAYRGLMSGKMGQQIRDMMIATSKDNGQSFSKPLRISHDNWAVDGCPHTGPSLCSTKSGLYSMWYTEGNGTGLYYSYKENAGDRFSERRQVSDAGRHPQLSASANRFIMVWEENSIDQDHRTQVMCEINDGTRNTRRSLNPVTANAFLPVVTQTRDGFLVAFLMETKDGVGMYVTRL